MLERTRDMEVEGQHKNFWGKDKMDGRERETFSAIGNNWNTAIAGDEQILRMAAGNFLS